MVSPLVSLDPPRDRLEFWVRFVCGAVFGTLLGLMLFWRILPASGVGWLALPVGMLLSGLAAAYWGGSFWHRLSDYFVGGELKTLIFDTWSHSTPTI